MKCAGPVTSVASVSEHDAKVAASPGRFEFRIVAAPTEHRAPRACRAAKETTGQWSQSELATSWASAPWWADGSVVVSRRPLRDATALRASESLGPDRRVTIGAKRLRRPEGGSVQ